MTEPKPEVETLLEEFDPEEFNQLFGTSSNDERHARLKEVAEQIGPERIRELLSRVTIVPPMSSSREPFESAVAFVHVEPREATTRRLLLAYPQAIFKPTGLWLWGCDPTTLVHDMKVGNITGYSLSHVALPGLYFEAGLSFEAFETLLEKTTPEWSHEKLKDLPPVREHQKIRLNTAEVGNNIVLDVEGPITHAVMWGKTVL